MKTIVFIGMGILYTSCQPSVNKEDMRKEIFQTEKAFEKMTSDSGIAEAFYYYADENAVIKRERDTLIKGKENIKKYYESRDIINATVSWTPDYLEVSDCGTLGYTYGRFVWMALNEAGDTLRHTGVFHTVWKKQPDHTWRYVWD